MNTGIKQLPVRVRFVKQIERSGVQGVWLLGSTSELGSWKRTSALEMCRSSDGVSWSLEVELVSSEIEYKYLIKIEDKEDLCWEPVGDNLRIHPQELRGRGTEVVVVDDTSFNVVFEVNCRHATVKEVLIVGSIPELGLWKAEKGVRLTRRTDSLWRLRVSVLSAHAAFEYKIVAKNNSGLIEWERDPNRVGDLKSCPVFEDGSILLWHSFNEAAVRLTIFHRLPAGARMCVVGGHPGLADWKWPSPQRMVLGPERELLTGKGARGRCWETTFPVTDEQAGKPIPYRYLAKLSDGSYLVENEPNRVREFPKRNDPRIANGVFEIFDANFVAGLNYDKVPVDGEPDIYIGSYVQSRDDVDELQELGVGAVFNLQTADDISKRQVSMDTVKSVYKERKIEFIHFPIVDNDPESFVQLGLQAAQRFRDAVQGSKSKCVYVHCTAGMGRAPSTVIAYLALFKGQTVEQAYKHVTSHRTVASPSIQVIYKVVAMGQSGGVGGPHSSPASLGRGACKRMESSEEPPTKETSFLH